jgi:hypothetical protein
MPEFDVAVLTERYLKGWHDAYVVGLMGYEVNEERRRCGLIEVAKYVQETFPAQVEEAVLQDLAKSRLRIGELEAQVESLKGKLRRSRLAAYWWKKAARRYFGFKRAVVRQHASMVRFRDLECIARERAEEAEKQLRAFGAWGLEIARAVGSAGGVKEEVWTLDDTLKAAKELGNQVVQTYEEDDLVTKDMAKADWAHAYSNAVAAGDRFVLVELTIPVVMHYPKDWDNALIEFFMGGGSSCCGSNWWSHIERAFTISGCMCEDLNHRVVRDATTLEAETGVIQEPYENGQLHLSFGRQVPHLVDRG